MKIYVVRFFVPTIYLYQIWTNSYPLTYCLIQYSFCCRVKRLTMFHLLAWIFFVNFHKKFWSHINIFRLCESFNTTEKRRWWEKFRTIKMLLSFMNYYFPVLLVCNYVNRCLFLMVLSWSFEFFTSLNLWFIRGTKLIFYFLLSSLFHGLDIIESWSRYSLSLRVFKSGHWRVEIRNIRAF